MNKRELIKSFSDNQLLQSINRLKTVENKTIVEILLHLNEVESRKLYLERGYSSLFAFCTQGPLKYSEPAAHRRISSARVLARFPELIELLINAEVSLTTLSLAANILNEENKNNLISKIRGKSRREVEEVLCGYRKKGDTKDSIKPISIIPKKSKKQKKENDSPLFSAITQKTDNLSSPEEELAPEERKYELKFSASEEIIKKYEAVKSLLSNKYPMGVKMEDLFNEVLEVYLDRYCPHRREDRRSKRLNRRKKSLSPEKVKTMPSRHIPKANQDQVYKRNKGRCAFVSSDGIRCNSTHNLQIHHIDPYAKSKNHSVDNLMLLCREHNIHMAKVDYGEGFMKRYCQ